MSQIYFIVASSMPLIIATVAVLFSEYTGRMIFFMDGIITLSAFLCYTFSVITKNLFLGITLAVILPLMFVTIISIVIEKFNFNYFIASLAQNVFLLSLVSVLSVLIFKTRGVLVSEVFSFEQKVFRIVSCCVGILIIISSFLFLQKTKTGLYLRITGSDSQVLKTSGVNPLTYRVMSWMIASVFGSFVGIILLFRISSFVPGISSGIGWASIAIVFLGKRKIVNCVLMAFLFGATQYVANNIQSISVFKNVPSAILLSLPYIISIIFILIIPEKKK